MTTLMSRLFVDPMVKARRVRQTVVSAAHQDVPPATSMNTQGPWCCSEGQRLRLFVPCAECADTSAQYSAAMAPVRGDEA